MKTIKFSHRYCKMPISTDQTVLLEVLKGKTKDLCQCFVDYDTRIASNSVRYYDLAEGTVLILLLMSYDSSAGTWRMWTTIRRWTAEKEKYYRSTRGQKVKIEIKGESHGV